MSAIDNAQNLGKKMTAEMNKIKAKGQQMQSDLQIRKTQRMMNRPKPRTAAG